MTARDFLTIFRRRWFLLVMAMLIGLAVGYLTSIDTDDEVQTYRGTHTLTVNSDILSPVAIEGDEPSGATVTASQYAVLIDRGPVPIAAAERLEYTGDPTTLASELDIEPSDDLGTIEITGRPGELLLYTFGRSEFAQVEISGSTEALAAT